MFGLKGLLNSRLDRYANNRLLSQSAFNSNTLTNPFSNLSFESNKPQWVSMSTPGDFEKAIRFNPIVKAALNLLATSGSNGKKALIDAISGEEIPWTDKNKTVQKAYNLLVLRPNPIQSAKEFYYQGIFYLKGYGNRFVYALMPSGMDKDLDLMSVATLYNLPSQYMEVRTTGKIYNQTTIEGIISKYARTNISPIELYEPGSVLHSNEVNISSDHPTVLGISKLEVLKQPISNIQLCFESMNTILATRGMQGIVSVNTRDGQGTVLPLRPEQKKEIDDKFKNDYGLLNGQNPFLLSPMPLEYIKTIMTAEEIGIYKEFSNNSIIIGNEYGIPPELIKTYIQGATYENQVQSVRRLYQDTTIPMVSDEDEYWNYRFDTQKYGFKITTKWDHIPALQDAFKEKAQAISLKGKTAKEAYTENIITVNQYLEFIEQPALKTGGDVFKFEWDKNKQPIENEGQAE